MFSGYKTVVFNVIMGLIALVKALNPDAVLPGEEEVNQGIDGFLLSLGLVWGVGGVILRAITSSPIFRKKPEEQ
jgi:hypothetical protein